MRKFFALYVNELIKSYKKLSVIIIISLMVIMTIGYCGLMKISEVSRGMVSQSDEEYLSRQKAQLDTATARLSELKNKEQNASESERANLTLQEKSAQNQIDLYRYAVDNKIDLTSNNYRAKALNMVFDDKQTIEKLESVPQEFLNADQKKQLSNLKITVDSLQEAVRQKDFNHYISVSNDQIKNDTTKSADEKKISLEMNDLRLKYQLTGETDKNHRDNTEDLLSQIESGKRSLLFNMDYTGNSASPKPLTSELRSKIENDIAVNCYKIANGIDTKAPSNGINMKNYALSGMLGLGIFMIMLLLMILAGGSVSQEISTGSIKSLIISPARRWKIFVAKLLSLITIGIAGGLILYLVVIGSYGVFYGFTSGSPYVFASGGVACHLNFYLFLFLKLFSYFIEILFYMVFALMLSVITRNTAASVGISIAAYFGGNIANQFLLMFAKGEWLKFIPFNNFNFPQKFFPYDSTLASSSSATLHTTLLFSLCYIAVVLICMGYVALDSFNRRDIK